ncbi:MAG: hypothetical protein HWD59_02415 [Coxiellaceae bacterium]|nr:MAG: hypothetical protein HWD59_02415 [Coxiellaceae bacterium]
MNISRRLLQGLIGLLLIISIGGQAMADSPGPGGKFPAVRAARVVKKYTTTEPSKQLNQFPSIVQVNHLV